MLSRVPRLLATGGKACALASCVEPGGWADAAAAIATASDRSEDLTRRRGERIDAPMVVKALFGREFGWV